MDRAVMIDLLAETAAMLARVADGHDCAVAAKDLAGRLSDLAWKWRQEDNEDELKMIGVIR